MGFESKESAKSAKSAFTRYGASSPIVMTGGLTTSTGAGCCLYYRCHEAERLDNGEKCFALRYRLVDEVDFSKTVELHSSTSEGCSFAR